MPALLSLLAGLAALLSGFLGLDGQIGAGTPFFLPAAILLGLGFGLVIWILGRTLLSARPLPLPAVFVTAGLVGLSATVALGILLFDTDRATIRPQYEGLIRELAAAVERQRGGTLEVHGHADHRASDDYNMKLAMRRAKAVAEAIAALLTPEARARLRVEAVDSTRIAGADHP